MVWPPWTYCLFLCLCLCALCVCCVYVYVYVCMYVCVVYVCVVCVYVYVYVYACMCLFVFVCVCICVCVLCVVRDCSSVCKVLIPDFWWHSKNLNTCPTSCLQSKTIVNNINSWDFYFYRKSLHINYLHKLCNNLLNKEDISFTVILLFPAIWEVCQEKKTQLNLPSISNKSLVPWSFLKWVGRWSGLILDKDAEFTLLLWRAYTLFSRYLLIVRKLITDANKVLLLLLLLLFTSCYLSSFSWNWMLPLGYFCKMAETEKTKVKTPVHVVL